tara:strand:+ start:480 stop:1667 length:1188 start_codon:yes stop_codon:yes gene_type:complete
MAPKTKPGRPSKESMDIAKDLKKALKDLQSTSDDVNSSLSSALGIEEDINGVVNEIINSKKTGLKVDDNIGKAAVERVKMTGKLLKLTDDQLQIVYKLKTGFTNLVKNARAFISVLLANPFLAIGAAILAAGKFLFGLVKDAQELRREFGFSVVEATKLTAAIKAASFASKAFLLESEDVEETFKALAKTFGEVNLQTVGFSLELTRAARNIGLGNEEAAELLATVSAATGQSKDLALNTIETIASLARAEGVAPGVLFKDLASSAEVFASFIGKGEQNLIKAAAAARKVGLEIGNVVQLGDNLLDVTDRIQKEQTLSILLGRQVSLARFVQLSAQNRTEEANRELATQLRGIEGLGAQQTRFAAQAVDLTVEELIKITALLSQGNRDRKSLAFD